MNARVFLVVAVAVILLFKNAETPGAFLRHQVGGQGLRAGRSSPWTSCRNLSPPSCATSGAGTTLRFRGTSTWFGPARSARNTAARLEGDALVLSALEIIAHFDPLMWVIENPATGLLQTRPFMERLFWVDVTYCKYGTPYRKQTRLWTNMRWRPRRSLCRPGSRCEAWQDGRHLRAAQRGPRLMEGQYERVSQSRELLYSVPAALCEEIARAATEELAERLSIPD